MIDLHTHIIPGVDDGAKELDLSLEMLRQAHDYGLTTGYAPPHLCGEIDLDCKQGTISARDSNAPGNTDPVFISSYAVKPTDDADREELGFDFIGENK